MKKLKDFFSSPKKTAILGLIGSLLMLLDISVSFSPLDNLYVIGLIVYFIIILFRIFAQKGNLKIANYTLIITYLVQLLMIIPNIKYNSVDRIIVYVVSFVIILLYLVNILLRKKNFVNNKIFAITIILYTLLQLFPFIKNGIHFFGIRYTPLVETTIYIINDIGYIFIIPYFYNYYNILRGENKNG